MLIRRYKLLAFYSFIFLIFVFDSTNLANGESEKVNSNINAGNSTTSLQNNKTNSSNVANSQGGKNRSVTRTDTYPNDNNTNNNNERRTDGNGQMLAEGVVKITGELNQNANKNTASIPLQENKGSPTLNAGGIQSSSVKTNNDTVSTTTTIKPIIINNPSQSTTTIVIKNSTTPTSTAIKEATRNATLTTTTTVATTTTTTKAPTPTKPHITEGMADLPESELEKANKQSSSSILPEPEVAPDRESPNIPPYHTNRDYIVPIVTVMLTVPFIMVIFVMVYRRFRDYWTTRHYRRMDFLLDGMYND